MATLGKTIHYSKMNVDYFFYDKPASIFSIDFEKDQELDVLQNYNGVIPGYGECLFDSVFRSNYHYDKDLELGDAVAFIGTD